MAVREFWRREIWNREFLVPKLLTFVGVTGLIVSIILEWLVT